MKTFILKNKSILTILLWMVLTLFISYNASHAQTVQWTTANQVSVTWDAVTMMGSDPIPAGDTVAYDLYLVPYASTDRDADKILAGRTTSLEYTYTLENEGKFLAGIVTVRILEDTSLGETYSTLVWSDSDDTEAVPVKFGFMYLMSPNKIKLFHPK